MENCKIIIELSLGIQLKGLRWKEGQRVIHNLPGKRGIRMDFCAEDLDGNIFDVEMQKENEGNLPKRTRFYQAMQDAPILKSGERGFDNLKPTVLILICGFDLFGHGRYQYTFENFCQEVPGLMLGDEMKKIILNTRGTNDEETSRSLIDFLHYVAHTEETTLTGECDERLKRLHEKMDEIKSSVEVGVMYMKMEERDRLIEERGRKEGWLAGRTEGRTEELILQIQKKVLKGKSLAESAEELEKEPSDIQAVYALVEENQDKTVEEILKLLK